MRFAKRCVALTALLAVAAMPVALAEERAAVAIYAGGVDFLPSVDFASATLTVSGNGVTFSQIVDRGRSLSIGPFDPEGQLLPDGVYRWQLELVPDERTAARLRAAASSGEEFDAWTAQSGSFAIRGGILADPSLMEEQAVRRATADSRPGTRSAFAPDRAGGGDDDATVGLRAGFEAGINAAAARSVPVAVGGALQQPGREAGDDSDAVSTALGGSLEIGAPSDNQLSAQPRSNAPRPRSDGSNGRPRS